MMILVAIFIYFLGFFGLFLLRHCYLKLVFVINRPINGDENAKPESDHVQGKHFRLECQGAYLFPSQLPRKLHLQATETDGYEFFCCCCFVGDNLFRLETKCILELCLRTLRQTKRPWSLSARFTFTAIVTTKLFIFAL
jgi:hypothetical protein